MAWLPEDLTDEAARRIEGRPAATSRLGGKGPLEGGSEGRWDTRVPDEREIVEMRQGPGLGPWVNREFPNPGPGYGPWSQSGPGPWDGPRPGSGMVRVMPPSPGKQYMHEVARAPGWKQEWNKYDDALGAYVSGRRKSVTEAPIYPDDGLPRGLIMPEDMVIPQKDWQDIASWFSKSGMPGFDEWSKTNGPQQRPQFNLTQLLSQILGQRPQQQRPTTIDERLLGPDRGAMDKYNQERGALQGIADRNRRKRGALSAILNMSQRNAGQYGYMPGGGGSGASLMDLIGRMQDKSLQNQFQQIGPDPRDEWARMMQYRPLPENAWLGHKE